jgi:anti-sigma factor RsiW
VEELEVLAGVGRAAAPHQLQVPVPAAVMVPSESARRTEGRPRPTWMALLPRTSGLVAVAHGLREDAERAGAEGHGCLAPGELGGGGCGVLFPSTVRKRSHRIGLT